MSNGLKAEKMISDSFVHIFESIPIGVMVIDMHGHVEAMNKHAKSLLNISDQSIEKQHLHTLVGNQDFIPITDLLATKPFEQTAGSKIKYKDKILDIMNGPLHGSGGVLLGAVVVLKDITETEKMQALERNKDKYSIIGEVSADMAHEIRNPLGSIELLASLFKKEAKRKKDINRANQIMAAVKTVDHKISQLIHFSKMKQIPVTYVNIHDILRDILLFSEKIIDGDTVILSAQYADIEPVIECNPDMMKQVFLNLILNALPEISRLDIITNYLPECQMIEISFIEKNGAQHEHVRSKILNRLSRTSEKSWGLGLAIVHNIVNMYKGYIRVEYLENVGTAFVLTLPLAKVGTSEPDKIHDPIENMEG